jgi:fatty acid desaturase
MSSREAYRDEDMMPTAAVQQAQAQSAALNPEHDLARMAYRLTSDLAKPNAAIYWIDLLLSAAVGYGAFALCYIFGMTFIGVAAALVSVLALYRCILFIHELTHLRKRTPRFFWTAWHVLVGVPMLLPSFLYEGIHNLHHAKAHYGTEGDPEYLQWARGRRRDVALMLPISAAEPLLLVLRFLLVMPVAALVPPARAFVLERMSAMVMNPRFRRTEPPPFRTAWLVLETVTTIYAWTIFILVLAGVIPLKLVLIALAIWSGMSVINMVRTLAAHHYENDGEPIDVVSQLLDTVNVPPPAMLPMLWAPVGLRYHGLHHLLPNLPYHSLGAAHRRLLERLPADSPYRATINRRVTDVLARMFRNQAEHRQHRKAAKNSAPGEAKIMATTR